MWSPQHGLIPWRGPGTGRERESQEGVWSPWVSQLYTTEPVLDLDIQISSLGLSDLEPTRLLLRTPLRGELLPVRVLPEPPQIECASPQCYLEGPAVCSVHLAEGIYKYRIKLCGVLSQNLHGCTVFH
ncbi:hypothetical protein EVAR_83042_1 [Eumeta japonica]|uniref:Uncharacterized protein n=1 Tax=Eumeta variegata TaxID=151549 RepID=A0A4C1VLK5_EUMVA|nr:hypothetical protein EVAR_83042_1 [Eumeta japonica]